MSDEGVGGAVIGNRLPFEAVFVTEYPKMVALAAAIRPGTSLRRLSDDR